MMRFSFSKSSSSLLILAKLLAEALLLILLGSTCFFLFEMILPGFVSSRINFSAPYILILALLILLSLVSPLLSLGQEKPLPPFSSTSGSLLKLLAGTLLLTLLFSNDMHGLTLSKSLLILSVLFLVLFFLLPFLLRKVSRGSLVK